SEGGGARLTRRLRRIEMRLYRARNRPEVRRERRVQRPVALVVGRVDLRPALVGLGAARYVHHRYGGGGYIGVQARADARQQRRTEGRALRRVCPYQPR